MESVGQPAANKAAVDVGSADGDGRREPKVGGGRSGGGM